ENLGIASLLLGAGRKTKDDVIDPSAGIILAKKTGDRVNKGETIAILHTSEEKFISDAARVLSDSIIIGEVPPKAKPVIIGKVD
ncbi:MAG: pyrimidine-nucleoside phosphorylase, partial [Clostridiaceae bacterium]|nr:pyrimidine-nucleoside phosphorylase [Clostridiaceae bacterium]